MAKKMTVKERKEYDQLIAYLRKKFTENGRYPEGLILKQLKILHVDYEMSYEDIKETIEYMTNEEDIELDLGRGIHLVPYYYEAMLQYKEEYERLSQTLVDIERDKLQPQQAVKATHKKRKTRRAMKLEIERELNTNE